MYGIVISYGYVFIFFLIDEIADIYIYMCISIYIYIYTSTIPSKIELLVHDKIGNPCVDR